MKLELVQQRADVDLPALLERQVHMIGVKMLAHLYLVDRVVRHRAHRRKPLAFLGFTESFAGGVADEAVVRRQALQG